MTMQRRKFIQTMMTVIGTVSISDSLLANNRFKAVRFGLVTDPHYADRAPANNRYYSESLAKVSECIDLMNEQQVDFLVELGDLKDQGTEPNEAETLRYLNTIEQEMRRFRGPLFHVLGNHDHDSISKEQFLKSVSNDGFTEATNFYSFDKGPFHFVVLDANYTSADQPYDHGNFDWTDVHIPGKQLKWLRKDLKRNARPTIIFVHHQLDSIAFPSEHRVHCPDNADVVREILEKSGNVLAVFQGHYHRGSMNRINNIYYYTLKAVVEGSGAENNNYAIVEIGEDKVMRIKGFRKTQSQDLI
jgi:predicted phosphodiesterase